MPSSGSSSGTEGALPTRCGRGPSSCVVTARRTRSSCGSAAGCRKGGAEGLLCAAHDRLGIALKVEDGAQRPLGPALATFVDQLGLESGALADAPIENSRGEVVGVLRVTG
jgi:L-asparaginase II